MFSCSTRNVRFNILPWYYLSFFLCAYLSFCLNLESCNRRFRVRNYQIQVQATSLPTYKIRFREFSLWARLFLRTVAQSTPSLRYPWTTTASCGKLKIKIFGACSLHITIGEYFSHFAFGDEKCGVQDDGPILSKNQSSKL